MYLDIDKCIPLAEIEHMLYKKKLVVYGAGNDGRIIKNYLLHNKIVFFIDKNTITDLEIPVFSLEKALEMIGEGINDYAILIGSRRYSLDMAEALKKKNLVLGNNYFFVDFSYDAYVKAFVDHNKKVWRKEQKKKRDSEVLITMISSVNIRSLYEIELFTTYYANMLADQLGADLKGFITDDLDCIENVFPSILDVYRSANISEVIRISLSKEQYYRCEALFDDVKKEIISFSDWNKIKIYGIDFGIAIMRNYLRYGRLEFEPRNEGFFESLKESIKFIVFWYDYFTTHKVKSVILLDGLYHEGLINSIAHSLGIPVFYLVNFSFGKTVEPHNFGTTYLKLKREFNKLSIEEREEGVKWGEERLKLLMAGSAEVSALYRGTRSSIFDNKPNKLHLPATDKLRVIVCPHIFNEDSWHSGEQICDNYFGWLECLGEMSNVTDYEWYIKQHPDEMDRGRRLIEAYVKRYNKMKILPTDIAPSDLVKAGFRYAFTVNGSIGHEYPYIGINVINAGNNPHISFDFCINPKSKKELEEIIENLHIIDFEPNLEELYQFYYIAYKKNMLSDCEDIGKLFDVEKWYDRTKNSDDDCSNLFEEFINFFDIKWHEEVVNKIKECYKKWI